jgi:cobalt-zinc-cadmium efflux system membrane fusion protein
VKSLLIALFLFLLTTTGSWAHGSEKHADLRAEPDKPDLAAGPPRVTTRQFQLSGGNLTVEFSQQPADPIAGDSLQLEANLKKKLVPPDPLLGDEMTLEGATVTVTESGQPSREAHPESKPGTYGIHLEAVRAGTHRLDWTVKIEGQPDLHFDYSYQVTQPLKQRIAWILTGLFLGSALVYSVMQRRLPLMGWIGAGLASLVVIGYAYFPTTKTPPLAASVQPQSQKSGIVIPPDLQRDLDMTFEPIRWQEVPDTLKVPGTVRIPQGATHNLHARFTSRIVSDSPRVGRIYQQGEELAVLEEVLTTADRASLRSQTIDLQARRLEFSTRQIELRRQLVELESRRQVAVSQQNQSLVSLKRAEQLYAIQALPLKELQAARASYNQASLEIEGFKRQQSVLQNSPLAPELPPAVGLQQYSLVAPVSGVLSKVDAAPGEVVDPSKVLFTLVNLRTVWIEARVPEKDLAAAKGAGRAQISTTAYPGPYYGRFTSLSPSLDLETRTALVYFEVDNRKGDLLEGMSAEVSITGRPQRVLTVASEALQTFDKQSRLFVKIDDDRFESRSVQVDRNDGKFAVIHGDIQAGTQVVVKGAGALASEMARRAKVSPSTATPTPNSDNKDSHNSDGHSQP